MANFGTMVLTQQGIALLNKAQTGVELRFTRCAVGDGILGGQSLEELTALINEKMSFNINLLQTEGGLATLRVTFSNAGLTEGFYVREFGVFAQDPDIGEILYSVANAGSQADFLPPEGSNVVEEIFDLVTVIASAPNVTAEINESLTYITQAQLERDILAAGWDYYGDTDPKTIPGIVVKPFFRWVAPSLKRLYMRNLTNTAWIEYMDLETGLLVGANADLGVAKEYYGAVLPPRHLWANGCTIGDAQSNATGRANADVFDLYEVLWPAVNNDYSQIKIYNSDGVLTEKGASAAADFAAHKAISLPDKRGRVGIGLDNMGGTSANVVTDNKADIIGGIGGEEEHSLTANENGPHRHGLALASAGSSAGEYQRVYQGGSDVQTALSGNGAPHNNLQPWIACNWIMRY